MPILSPTAARAATITPVTRDAAGASTLAAAIAPSGVSGARFTAVPPSGSPHAVSTTLSHFPTQGGDFAILSTGNAQLADDANVSGSSGASLGGGPVRGNTDFDVSVLEIDLSVPAGRNCLRLDFAFYSDEFPEFVGSGYNDAFIAELDSSTWTTSGSSINAPKNFAFDNEGHPISINSSGPTAMNLTNAGGTTYDGATVLLEAATPVTSGAHKLYLSIFDQGDQIYDSAAFVDNLRFDSVANVATDCAPGAKSAVVEPLIFLHGITGSFLKNAHGDEVWPDEGDTVDYFEDPHLDVLKLQADGITPWEPNNPDYQISVKTNQGIEGIIDTTRICLTSSICYVAGDAYETTFEFLENEGGYTRGTNLFPFAFDWRLSAGRNAQRLLDKIDAVRAQTGADRVNIMAHSQGGLVTSAALKDARSIGKVNRVVTLGTPYLGATKAHSVLDYAEPCQAMEILGGCILARKKAQELVTNYPGHLELLPSRAFYNVELSPIHRQIDDDGDGFHEGFLPFEEVRAQLADRNLALIDQAAAFHQNLDQWAPADPSVKLFRVVGDASATITKIIQFEEESCSGILWWRDCEMEESFQFFMGNGDGTVPLHSADLNARGFDYRGSGQNAYAAGIGHGELPKEEAVLEFALGFLAGGAQAQAAATQFKTVSLASAAFGTIGDQPTPLSGTEIVTRGPLQGLVSGSGDGKLGTVDAEHGIELQTIPGSTFSPADSTASYFVTRNGAYGGSWSATSQGEVALTLREYTDDDISSTVSTPRFSVGQGAKVGLQYAQPADVSALAATVDDDGDGDVDRTIDFGTPVTGAASSDVVPPTSTISVRKFTAANGNRMAEVTIAATDEGGSGVDRIEYGLDASSEGGTYTGPITIPAHGEIYVRAIDRAGNVEAPYKVAVLDEGPSDPELVTLSKHANVEGFLDHAGDVDWWGWKVEAGRHQFQLIGPNRDYDLALYSADGTLIASSEGRTNAAERIVAQLETGTYYVRVTGFENAFDAAKPYRLNLTRLGS